MRNMAGVACVYVCVHQVCANTRYACSVRVCDSPTLCCLTPLEEKLTEERHLSVSAGHEVSQHVQQDSLGDQDTYAYNELRALGVCVCVRVRCACFVPVCEHEVCAAYVCLYMRCVRVFTPGMRAACVCVTHPA